jgi:hypothetical protein
MSQFDEEENILKLNNPELDRKRGGLPLMRARRSSHDIGERKNVRDIEEKL